MYIIFFFFFQAEDGIRDGTVTGVQTCALPILARPPLRRWEGLPDGGQRRVAGLVVGERAERRLGWRLVIEPDQVVEGDRPVGEGAGLVQAHHVHPGQALDRGKLLPSTRRRASVTAATPNATLVSSTRPCGTMPTSAATVPMAASRSVRWPCNWLITSSTARRSTRSSATRSATA